MPRQTKSPTASEIVKAVLTELGPHATMPQYMRLVSTKYGQGAVSPFVFNMVRGKWFKDTLPATVIHKQEARMAKVKRPRVSRRAVLPLHQVRLKPLATSHPNGHLSPTDAAHLASSVIALTNIDGQHNTAKRVLDLAEKYGIKAVIAMFDAFARQDEKPASTPLHTQ